MPQLTFCTSGAGASTVLEVNAPEDSISPGETRHPALPHRTSFSRCGPVNGGRARRAPAHSLPHSLQSAGAPPGLHLCPRCPSGIGMERWRLSQKHQVEWWE